MFFLRLVFIASLAVVNFYSIVDADSLTLLVNGKELQLEGEILIEAKDNSLYFREVDGKIWFVEPQQIKARVDSEKPSPPLSFKAVGERLLKELPAGFRIYETKHYVIAYQNEVAFARWISGLYESRLYRAFETFWEKKKKFKLSDPKYPLIAIVLVPRLNTNNTLTGNWDLVRPWKPITTFRPTGLRSMT